MDDLLRGWISFPSRPGPAQPIAVLVRCPGALVPQPVQALASPPQCIEPATAVSNSCLARCSLANPTVPSTMDHLPDQTRVFFPEPF